MMSDINLLQRNLSVAQAFPVVGPIVVSPTKAIVSLAQVITGFSKAVFFGTGVVISFTFRLEKALVHCLKQSGNGFLEIFNGTCSLSYSLANICTLGMTGFFCETFWYSLHLDLRGRATLL